MSWARQAAALALVATIALATVTFASEANTWSEDLVLAEEPILSSDFVVPPVEMEVTTTVGLLSGVKAKDNSKDAANTALNDAAKATSEGNKAARKAMLGGAAEKAKAQVQKALHAMQDTVVSESQSVAQSIGSQIASKELKSANTTVGAEDGVHKLEEDTHQVEAAEEAEEEEFENEKSDEERDLAEKKETLAAKTAQIDEDFKALQEQVDALKGVRTDERSRHQELATIMEKVRCLNQTLVATQERLSRMQERHKQTVAARNSTSTEAKNHLNEKLMHYKAVLKGLQSKLHQVQNATDINEQIATRISTAQGVVKAQYDKIGELKSDVTALQGELETTQTSIEEYKEAATRRKKALHEAFSEIDHLSSAADLLKAKVGQHAQSIQVNQTLGHSASTTASKGAAAVSEAIDETLNGAKEKLAAKVIETAIRAAKKVARKIVADDATKEQEIQPPNLQDAISEAGDLVATLGLENSTATAHVSPAELIQPLKHDRLDATFQEATSELTELHNDAVRDEQVHHAELLAHVAHRLFVHSAKTGKASDKNTAKVAMKRALAAREAVEADRIVHEHYN